MDPALKRPVFFINIVENLGNLGDKCRSRMQHDFSA